MLAPPKPTDEHARLRALRALEVLDTPPDPGLDALVELVAELLEVPIALVSLVDDERQWFKARVGLAATETSRAISFCGHAVAAAAPFVVPDATLDHRFADNPMVLGAPHVRFYASVPLRSTDGHAVGTLCAIDHVPRELTAKHLRVLERLTRLAEERLATLRQLALARRVVDAVPGMLAYWDIDERCQFANRAYAHWFALEADELVGRRLVDVLGPIYETNRSYLTAAFAGRPQFFEREIRSPAGPVMDLAQVHYVPHTANGQVLGIVVMVTDISRRKQLEEGLTRSVREREELVQEVHHRVKNNLQVISSLINLQLRGTGELRGFEVLQNTQRRIASIGLLYELLHETGDYVRVPFEKYARRVVSVSMSAVAPTRSVELTTQIDAIPLSVEQAVPCGLLVNELITIALDHPAPDDVPGRIEVRVRLGADDQVELAVTDDGAGNARGADGAPHLGHQLTAILAEQLDGTLVIERGVRTRARVSFPLRPA